MQLAILSEQLIEPQCSHFRLCGGCKFQHIPYDEQLSQKRDFVSGCFGIAAEKVIACDPPWRYRNKMEFSFSQARSGEKFLGLMKSRGRVENLSECYLTNEWFAETLCQVRDWWRGTPLSAYNPPLNQGNLRTLTLREGRRTGERMALLTTSEELIEEHFLTTFVDLFADFDAVIWRKQIVQKKKPTHFQEQILKGRDHIFEILHGADGTSYRFRIRAASFFQPNTLQAERIYQEAIALADLHQQDELLDLYCGTGSLGIFASSYVSCVKGIEIVPEAVEDARANLILNQVSNMELFLGDVGHTLSESSFQPTTVIVDPPRVGLGAKTIAELHRLKPEKIIYISCNPISQAADCSALGYQILALQPIDQFPHTPHIENIALLKRRS